MAALRKTIGAIGMNETLTPLLVDTNTAAGLLSVSRSKFYEMLSSNRLPIKPVLFGSKKLWQVEILRAWVEAGCPASWEQGGEDARY